MKISILGPAAPFRGGIAQFTDNMAKHMSKKHDVTIFTFIQQYPIIFFPGKNQYVNSSLRITERINAFPTDVNSQLPTPILTPYNPFTWKKAAKEIQKNNPELLIIKFWIPFFCPAYTYIIKYLKKHSKIKISILCHNIEFHEKWIFSDFLVKKMLKNVDKVIVLSENVFIQAQRYVPIQKINKLFHPIYEIETENSQLPTPNSQLKEGGQSFQFLKIPENPTVLFLGYIKPYKGLDILLKAIPLVHEKLPEVQFVIAGEIYGKDSCYTKLLPSNPQNIIFKNQYIPFSEIQHYMNIADVVVVPYRSASQSGIIQIAYSYLLPVIASDVPGLREMIVKNKTGYLFKSEDINDLAKSIIKFYNEKNMVDYKKYITDNNQDYTWEKFVLMI